MSSPAYTDEVGLIGRGHAPIAATVENDRVVDVTLQAMKEYE